MIRIFFHLFSSLSLLFIFSRAFSFGFGLENGETDKFEIPKSNLNFGWENSDKWKLFFIFAFSFCKKKIFHFFFWFWNFLICFLFFSFLLFITKIFFSFFYLKKKVSTCRNFPNQNLNYFSEFRICQFLHFPNQTQMKKPSKKCQSIKLIMWQAP